MSQSVLQAGYGIAVKKGSLWKHHISKSILKYKEDNALISLNEKWLGGPCSLAGNMTDNHQRLPLEYFGGAYVVLAVAIAVSIVIVGIEWLYRKYTKHLSYLVNLDSTT